MPSPSSGAYADELLERARERRLAVKSGLNRDFEQRHGGLHHQLLRVQYQKAGCGHAGSDEEFPTLVVSAMAQDLLANAALLSGVHRTFG